MLLDITETPIEVGQIVTHISPDTRDLEFGIITRLSKKTAFVRVLTLETDIMGNKFLQRHSRMERFVQVGRIAIIPDARSKWDLVLPADQPAQDSALGFIRDV